MDWRRSPLEVSAHVRDLAEKTGTTRLVLQVFASAVSVWLAGNYASARVLADELLNLSEREHSASSKRFAHEAQSWVRFATR